MRFVGVIATIAFAFFRLFGVVFKLLSGSARSLGFDFAFRAVCGFGSDFFASGLFFGSGFKFFHGKSDAVALETDDLRFDFLTFFKEFRRFFHIFVRNLRNVDKTVDAVLDLYERSERMNPCDGAFDDRADRIFFGGEFIRFLLKLFVTERDFAGFTVGLQNDEVVSLVEFQNFGRLADFLPAEIADVSEAVVTFDAHERSERSKAFDLALNDSAGNDG